MIRTPDPISQAEAYQAMLLEALGADDPAAAQASTADAIRALVADAGSHLRTRPAPGEWSALLCLAHVYDAEIVMSSRYRFVLAHDEPELVGYDQDLFVDGLHTDSDDAAAYLRVFEPLRAANVALWRATSDEQRARVGLHRERGPESYDLMFRMLAGHDRVHLDQARRALETVRG